jgi:hypothetical protein
MIRSQQVIAGMKQAKAAGGLAAKSEDARVRSMCWCRTTGSSGRCTELTPDSGAVVSAGKYRRVRTLVITC